MADEATLTLAETTKRAFTAYERGQLGEAERLARAILGAKADYCDALHLIALVYARQRRFDEALAGYDRALAVRPDFAEALNNRGNALQELKRFDEALASYDRALAVRPNYAEALNNRGYSLHELKRFDEALASYERALAVRPDYAEVLNNRGRTLEELKRFDEALASYDRAIALKPDYARSLANRAICKLRLGRFIEGWADYEWRRDAAMFHGQRPDFPIWNGERLEGRRLLILSEQGLGDVIQFVRYLPLLAQHRCEVTFLAPANLIRLLRSVANGIEIVSALGGGRTFDFQCALLSLPHRFGTDLTSIPSSIPYLQAEDALIARWQERIGPYGFKVGICWQGNPSGSIDQGRSIPLGRFWPLGQIPGVRLISLQTVHGLEQLAGLPAGMVVETLGEDFDAGADAFVDCAAAMHGLDLVVTCDTAIGHLAGALGRPVWLALKQVPHWPWMLDRSDNPWYPSMRLFRQPSREAWEPLFDEMAAELRKLAHGNRSSHVAQSGGSGPQSPLVPVSWGELIDKITILEVKSERLTSPQALANVGRELTALEAVLEAIGQPSSRISELRADLRAVNARLFEIEDALREREALQQFDDMFVQLARSVYCSNDERARIKREINSILNSEFIEEKQYARY